MSEKITIGVFRPGQPVAFETIDHTLEAMQAVVGGLIEQVMLDRNGLIAFCNEEGKLEGLPENREIGTEFAVDVLVGTFFVCQDDGEEVASVRDEDRDRLAAWHPGHNWNVRIGQPQKK